MGGGKKGESGLGWRCNGGVGGSLTLLILLVYSSYAYSLVYLTSSFRKVAKIVFFSFISSKKKKKKKKKERKKNDC